MQFFLTGALCALAVTPLATANPNLIGCDGKSSKAAVNMLDDTAATVGGMGAMTLGTALDGLPDESVVGGTTVKLDIGSQSTSGALGVWTADGSAGAGELDVGQNSAQTGCTHLIYADTPKMLRSQIDWVAPAAGGTFHVHLWTSAGFGQGIVHSKKAIVVTPGTTAAPPAETPQCSAVAGMEKVTDSESCEAFCGVSQVSAGSCQVIKGYEPTTGACAGKPAGTKCNDCECNSGDKAGTKCAQCNDLNAASSLQAGFGMVLAGLTLFFNL